MSCVGFNAADGYSQIGPLNAPPCFCLKGVNFPEFTFCVFLTAPSDMTRFRGLVVTRVNLETMGQSHLRARHDEPHTENPLGIGIGEPQKSWWS